MATNARCPTWLVADTPADTDAFGGHERVAGAIAEVVQSETGGRSIGLEGEWGSGKSTVVRLTEKELGQATGYDHGVAVFDLWAHQGDPLRRTFLESLIARVQEIGWVDREYWNRRRDELTRRRRENTTRTVPRLTGAGVSFALTLLVIPIGAALISAGATLWGSDNSPSRELVLLLLGLGILAAFAPLFSLAVMTGIRHWRKPRTGEGENNGILTEFPALVTGQSSTESRTIVTQTPDPTSVEFEYLFRELLGKALEPTDRRLLIVLDNLDRVQPSDALSIWSTLQTFLGNSDYLQADWLGRLWILIPYDNAAILRLWDGSNNDAGKPDNAALAESFLDKTFQLRFRVPSLLLSNWRGFLQDALKQALPAHSEAEFHDVYRAFATKGGLETSAPTPRDLKIFVNQIGALHRQWEDEYPLSYLACYVLFQKDAGNMRDVLLSRGEPEFLRRNIGRQWREVISALHFGVTANEANQLLLRGPIQVALANGDGETLSRLASIHPEGFWAVLEDSVPAGAEEWNRLSPTDLAKAASALVRSRILDQSDNRPEATAVRSSIIGAAGSISTWAPFNTTTAQGMVDVGLLAGKSGKIIPTLLVGASGAPVEAPEGEDQDENSEETDQNVSPSVWMASALDLIQGLVDGGLSDQLKEGIKVPLSAQQWLEVCSEVAEKDPDGLYLRYFDIEAIKEVDQLLAEQVVPGQISDDIADAVYATMATRSNNGMNDTAKTVLSRLESDEVIQADQLAFILEMLRFSKTAGLISKEQDAELATNGYYLHHLHQAVSGNHAEMIAACMFGFLESVPDATEPPEVGNSSAGFENLTTILEAPDTADEVVEHFIANVINAQQLPMVFGIAARQQPVRPFLSRTIRFALLSRDASKPLELVRERWSIIRDILREEEGDEQNFEAFMKEWPELGNLSADVVNGDFDIGECGLYAILASSTAATNIVTWCANGLASVSREEWVKEIESNGDLVHLVMVLGDRGANMKLDIAYLDALVDYAKSVADGLERVLPSESWHELLALLEDSQQKMFARRVYDVLQGSAGNTSAKFFDMFSDSLSEHDLTQERRFLDQVCRPFLVSRNVRGLAWMADVAESKPSLFTESGDLDGASDFKSRVRNGLQELKGNHPILPYLKRIGAVLGIESVEREGPEAEPDEPADDTGEAAE